MSIQLHHRKHIEDELAQSARRQLRNAACALTTSVGHRFRSAVHESRKTVKNLRAVAALLKGAGANLPREDRKRLKLAAKALSKVRDSAAMVDTFDRLRRRYPTQLPEHTYGILRRGLIAARDRTERRAQRSGVVAEAAHRLEKTRKSVRTWKSPSITRSRMIAIVAASYRRSRQAMNRARATGQSATLHHWRKELKTLWYQLHLVSALIAGVAPLLADLHRLETELGDDHNLVVLGATLRGCRDLRSMESEIRQVDRLAARMRQPLRRRAFVLGHWLHVQKPEGFARWLRAAHKRAPRRQNAA